MTIAISPTDRAALLELRERLDHYESQISDAIAAYHEAVTLWNTRVETITAELILLNEGPDHRADQRDAIRDVFVQWHLDEFADNADFPHWSLPELLSDAALATAVAEAIADRDPDAPLDPRHLKGSGTI